MGPRHTVLVRPARLHESRAMAVMSRDLIETGLGWRYTPARIAALIAEPDTVALVACDAGLQLQGFAVMQFGDEHAHLALLCVNPAQQRLGTGRRLVDWLLESARVAGIVSVRLELRADNMAALAFYRRLGFSQGQLVPDYYGPQVAARRMMRRLRATSDPSKTEQ